MAKSYKDILDEIKPKNIKFELDEFEQIRLRDLMNEFETFKEKIHRDLTPVFNNFIKGSHRRKDQIKINIKGRTRSGKSLVGLKIISEVGKLNLKPLDVLKSVCDNQKVLKKKLQIAEYSDSYLVDENAFANVGAGSMTEMAQLKDINNIIAKNNNNIVYITPNVFLNTGAPFSLEYYGKDSDNWISRFLIYDTEGGMKQILLGFVVFDIGALFIENGCLIFKKTGGCTNPKRLEYKDIDKDYISNSSCIPKKFKKEDLTKKGQNCPFYNICQSQLCKYERDLKDKWIIKEMKGGLDTRELERLEVAFKLFKEFYVPETHSLRKKKQKELKILMNLKIPKLTSSKFTGVEKEEIALTIFSFLDAEFFNDVCEQLELNFEKEKSEINYNVENLASN